MRNPTFFANFDVQATYLKSSNLHWNYMSFEFGGKTEKMFSTPVDYYQKTQKYAQKIFIGNIQVSDCVDYHKL